MPTHFSDQFELGVSARKAGFTIQQRRRRSPTVMLMSRRAWCQETGSPRSREAFQSNPPVTNRSVILKFLSHKMHFTAFANECGRAGHAYGCNAEGRSCPKRVSDDQGASQIPRWDSAPAFGRNGSGNTRWRREFPGGNTEEPEADNFRGSANQKTDYEKLNDERGESPCQ